MVGRYSRIVLTGCAAVSAGCASSSYAQQAASEQQASAEDGGIADILVVARKRTENIQDVPIAITALSAEGLQERGIARVADLVGTVPNLTQDGGGSVLGAFGIRGIVSQTRNIGFDSGMGVYVDGVLTVRANGGDQELPDIASVEVLRGPQGTLFGRNTTAGAINITTRAPDLTRVEFDGRIAGGNLRQREASAYLSVPVVRDTLAIKLAGSIATREGYTRNVIDDRLYNGLNRKTLRAGLLWRPNADVKVALTGSYLKQEDGLILGQVANSRVGPLFNAPGYFADIDTIAQNDVNYQNREIWSTNLNIDWNLGDYTLTSISAYGDNRSDIASDDDGRPLPLSASNFRDGATQFTQELRLASPTSGRIDYLLGLFYLHQDGDADRSTRIFGPPGPAAAFGTIRSLSTLTTDAYAAFANVNIRPVARLTISGGLRYNSETKSLDFRQTNTSFLPLPNLVAQLDRTDRNVSGNASISYEATATTHLYASVARGFKSGGFNPDIVGDTNISFAPERVWAYEAGVKTDLFDRRLRVNVAAYYTDYSDLQVAALVGAAFQIRNAASATIKGFEVEVFARPVPALELNFASGYADAKYDDFPGCGANLNCAGFRLPFVPNWNVSAGAQLTQPAGTGEVVARADISYRGDVFYEAANFPDGLMPAYTLVNARLGYVAQDRRWGIAAYARNLFDRRYRDFSFYLAPFDQRLDRYAAPRTYGVELTTRF